jgi:hypothetical protein
MVTHKGKNGGSKAFLRTSVTILATTLLVSGVLFTFTACSGNSTVTQKISVDDFTSISSSGSVVVRVSVGNPKAVVVTGVRSAVDATAIRASGGTLYISTTSDFLPPDRPVIDVTAPSLDSVTTSVLGSGDVSIAGFAGGAFYLTQGGVGRVEIGGDLDGLVVDKSGSGDLLLHNLDVSGEIQVRMTDQGDMHVETVDADTFTINKDGMGDVDFKDLAVKGDLTLEVMDGFGNVTGAGAANNLIVRSFEYGDILLSNFLVSQNTDVRMWGSGNVVVSAQQSITGFNDGDGNLTYSGPAGLQASVQNTGTGTVTPMIGP